MPFADVKFAGEGLLGAAAPDTMTGSIESREMFPGNPLAATLLAGGGFGGGENYFSAFACAVVLEAFMKEGNPDVPAVEADVLLWP